MPNVRQSARQKFSFIEHLTEAFSVGCGSVCSQENIDPSVKAACDLGSQRYCSSDSIATLDCLAYADRLVRTRAAQRTNTVYSNSVAIPTSSTQTIASYYTSLGDSIQAHVLKNIDSLSSDSIVNLMKLFQSEEPSERQVYSKVSDAVIAELSKTNRPINSGISINWLKARAEELIKQKVVAYTREPSAINILNQIIKESQFMTMFYDLYLPVLDVLASKLSIEDVATPSLYTAGGPYLIKLVHKFIIEYIIGQSWYIDKYNIDLSKRPQLYNKYVLDAYKWLSANIKDDQLVALITAARNANMAYYISVDDVNNDPVCVAMILAGEPIPYEARCSSASNIVKPECIAFIEKKITAPGASIDDVYLSIIKSATDTSGNISKLVLDTYPTIKQWLSTKMSDESVTIDGISKITPVCGTEGNLSIAQCNQLCKMYPELCIPDQVQKCSLPNYRFAKEGLTNPSVEEGLCVEPPDNEQVQWWWIFVLALIVFAISAAWMKRKRTHRKQTRAVLPLSIESLSKQ